MTEIFNSEIKRNNTRIYVENPVNKREKPLEKCSLYKKLKYIMFTYEAHITHAFKFIMLVFVASNMNKDEMQNGLKFIFFDGHYVVF